MKRTDEPVGFSNAKSALDLVLADFVPVRQWLPPLELVDLNRPNELPPNLGAWIASPEPGEAQVLLIVGDNRRRIEFGPDLVRAKVSFADYLQDEVIDRSGRPWPEVVVNGQTVVLTPRAEGGQAMWMGQDGVARPVGELWAE
ncbi:MAG: hypothetical protein LBE08_08920 [Bifidobacteriaceae bacterium]|nr:hypothetical protein [Bifidobacteriaceae bacterium]